MHIMNIIFTFYQIVGPLQGLFKVNAGAYGRKRSLHGHSARSEKRLRSPSPCFQHERQFCPAQPCQKPRGIRSNIELYSPLAATPQQFCSSLEHGIDSSRCATLGQLLRPADCSIQGRRRRRQGIGGGSLYAKTRLRRVSGDLPHVINMKMKRAKKRARPCAMRESDVAS